MDLGSATWTVGAFTVTGQRYNISGLSVLNTSGAGSTFIPGNSAGSAATGAQYI